jgi:dTDP-4-amino-4,6-dideoxygalactose transaminase
MSDSAGTDPELAAEGGPAAAADLAVPDWPRATERSEEYVRDALRSGRWCRAGRDDGETWCGRFEAAFADAHDAAHARGVASGTAALEVALRALDVRPGDEVLLPAYTFVATASAVTALGAVPRLVDVTPRTYNVDPDAVVDAVTDRSVGLIAVHYAGQPADLDRLPEVAAAHDLFLIEDCAHAHGSAWRGERIGTVGDAGAFSFQETKGLPGGEGGAVITDRDDVAERVERIERIGRASGTRGHLVHAPNRRLPELSAALLTAQLEELECWTARKERAATRLRDALRGIDGINLPSVDDRVTERGYYFFTLDFDPEAFGATRAQFLDALSAEGVPAFDGYGLALHQQPSFARGSVREVVPADAPLPNYRSQSLPGAERAADRMVTLPHRVLLAEDLTPVADAVAKLSARADRVAALEVEE